MFDLSGQFDGVRREVSDVTRDDGGQGRRVVLTQTYDRAPHEVWEALTDRNQLSQWFEAFTGDLRLEGEFQLESGTKGTIKRCEQATGLGLKWEFEDDLSWVEITLTPEGEGTVFTLKNDMDVSEHYEQFGPAASGVGWDIIVAGLAGQMVGDPPDPQAEWLGSEAGAKFVKETAKRWAEADVAFGVEPDEADEKATKTAEFYTEDPDDA